MINLYMSGSNVNSLETAGPVTASFATPELLLSITSSTGTISATAYCPLMCGGLGDLNSDGKTNDILDYEVMASIVDVLQIFGHPPYPTSWPPPCLDITQDGYITMDDYECLVGQTPTACADCVPSSFASVEVCSDGYDNDCDGQIDKETYNNAGAAFYSYTAPTLKDLCDCNSMTPCEMVKDNGIYGIASESELSRCVSFDNGVTYAWTTKANWQCNSAKNGQPLQCGGGTNYVCNDDTGAWTWIKMGGGGTFPSNSYG